VHVFSVVMFFVVVILMVQLATLLVQKRVVVTICSLTCSSPNTITIEQAQLNRYHLGALGSYLVEFVPDHIQPLFSDERIKVGSLAELVTLAKRPKPYQAICDLADASHCFVHARESVSNNIMSV